MLPDSKNIVNPDSRGRDSIRISSKRAFDESVVIIDLEHMPHGCGTWPAFWTLSQKGPWPAGGEIDIIEVTHLSHLIFHHAETITLQGVHEAEQNLISLHTPPGCTMPERRYQTGRVPPLAIRLHRQLTGVLAERPSLQTVIPATTSIKVAAPKFAVQVPMVGISILVEVGSMPSPEARSTASRSGSGRGTRYSSRLVFDTTSGSSTRTFGVHLQPISQLETTAGTRSTSMPTCLSSI